MSTRPNRATAAVSAAALVVLVGAGTIFALESCGPSPAPTVPGAPSSTDTSVPTTSTAPTTPSTNTTPPPT